MNKTIYKFGYPDTLIKEYENWVVLIRPKQVTIGSLVLVCKENVENFSTISQKSFSELKVVITGIESTLKEVFKIDKINYLALMMVDKHVHFHVIPRYINSLSFKDKEYQDKDWPSAPDIQHTLNLSNIELQEIKRILKNNWSN